MKKLIVRFASVAVVAGMLLGPRPSLGQESKPAPSTPHQVGLIDMAHVFKEYQKFKALSDALRAEVEASDAEAKRMVEELQQLQAQLNSGNLTEGSADHARLEQALVSKSAELEAFRKMKQREFLRKEADIYKTVYLEVQDAVQKYATYYKYTLIMRFNRDKVETAENPQEIIQSMNRPVVFHRAEDDLTDPILKYLNDQYAKSTARAAQPGSSQPANRTATAPAGGARTQ